MVDLLLGLGAAFAEYFASKEQDSKKRPLSYAAIVFIALFLPLMTYTVLFDKAALNVRGILTITGISLAAAIAIGIAGWIATLITSAKK